MARIFISGSSTGLGLMAGQLLAEQDHQVVLHARDGTRANDTRRALPQAEAVVVGDLETIAGAREVAQQANALGRSPPTACRMSLRSIRSPPIS